MSRLLPAAIALLCLIGYFISGKILSQALVEKKFSYSSDTASEVVMAWGLIGEQLPEVQLWPVGTLRNGELLHTKMADSSGTFNATMKLRSGTEIYYWFVQKKDRKGNDIEVWDAGSEENVYRTFTFQTTFNPGYFIFLAGFLPLLLLYLRQRQTLNERTCDTLLRIKEYIPQFDSIRAIAVILVIIHHWVPENSLLNILPNGPLGVNIFFVLSGFLITGILFKSRKQVESKELSLGSAFKKFYIRRTLRIFPIYYILLLVFLIFAISPIEKGTASYFTYTSNFRFFSDQYFPARLSHLWSLAVEEQFYLLWPWLMMLASRPLLPYLIGMFFILGISTNYIVTSHGWWVAILTPTCFDAFAAGAFLSYLVSYRHDVVEWIRPFFRYLSLLVAALFISDVFVYPLLPTRTTHALFTLLIIYYCLFKNNYRLPNYVLNNRVLRYLGKISYGIYLYHLFVPELWKKINSQFYDWGFDPFFNLSTPDNIKPAWLFVQELAFLILICAVSWKLIEKPFNNLKRKFEYRTPGRAKASEIANANAQVVSN